MFPHRGEFRLTSVGKTRLLVAVGFAAVGFATVWIVTGLYGPGASLDSVTYLSVARNLATGQGFVRFDGWVYTAWPPLYPWLISLGVWAGLDVADAARVVGAGSFGITLAALAGILGRRRGGVGWAVCGLVLVFYALPLLNTFATAWSEAPFIALVTLACYLADRFHPALRKRDLLVLGLVAGACSVTRYVGAALVVALGLWLLTISGSFWQRVVRVLGFGLTASLAPGLWIFHTYLVTGRVFGNRPEGYAGLARNLREYLSNVSSYLRVESFESVGMALAALVLVGAPATALLIGLWRRKRGGVLPSVTVSALFILIYSGLLIGIASWVPVSRLERVRFAAPVWVPLIVLFVNAAAATWLRWPQRLARTGLVVGLLVVASLGLSTTYPVLRYWRHCGVGGYGVAKWHHSELLAALRSSYSGQAVVSNQPHVVYFHTLIPSGFAPRFHAFRSKQPRVGDIAALRARAEREGSVQLAWFLKYPRGHGYYRPVRLKELGVCMEAEGRYRDGVLLRVLPDRACSSE